MKFTLLEAPGIFNKIRQAVTGNKYSDKQITNMSDDDLASAIKSEQDRQEKSKLVDEYTSRVLGQDKKALVGLNTILRTSVDLWGHELDKNPVLNYAKEIIGKGVTDFKDYIPLVFNLLREKKLPESDIFSHTSLLYKDRIYSDSSEAGQYKIKTLALLGDPQRAKAWGNTATMDLNKWLDLDVEELKTQLSNWQKGNKDSDASGLSITLKDVAEANGLKGLDAIEKFLFKAISAYGTKGTIKNHKALVDKIFSNDKLYNAFQKSIKFASTDAADVYAGLRDYLKLKSSEIADTSSKEDNSISGKDAIASALKKDNLKLTDVYDYMKAKNITNLIQDTYLREGNPLMDQIASILSKKYASNFDDVTPLDLVDAALKKLIQTIPTP